MARYEVEVTETVTYCVPVDCDGAFNEDAIEAAAIEAFLDNVNRDRDWFVCVDERTASYVGTVD